MYVSNHVYLALMANKQTSKQTNSMGLELGKNMFKKFTNIINSRHYFMYTFKFLIRS